MTHGFQQTGPSFAPDLGLERLRGEIKRFRDAGSIPPPNADASRAWRAKYHLLICDYLVCHLPEPELPFWRDAHAALSEFARAAFEIGTRTHGFSSEERTWAQVDAVACLSSANLFAFLPKGFGHRDFLAHYQGLIRRSAVEGAINPADASRLIAELDELLARRR